MTQYPINKQFNISNKNPKIGYFANKKILSAAYLDIIEN
jgi:hypothetical protein